MATPYHLPKKRDALKSTSKKSLYFERHPILAVSYTWLSWDKVCVPKTEGGLGFRNLKAFNLALLAKQGWRLQTNTHSLVYLVLKAHYFPNCDYLNVELGPKPSFAWWSIIVAQSVVRARYRWQVGDGSLVRICLDKWLPKPTTFQTISPPNILPADARVFQLLGENIGEWKVSLIR